jgi:hypothetical protein
MPSAPSPGTRSNIPEVMAFVDDYLVEHHEAMVIENTRLPFRQRAQSVWRTVKSLSDFDPYTAIQHVADDLVPTRPELASRLRRVAMIKAME